MQFTCYHLRQRCIGAIPGVDVGEAARSTGLWSEGGGWQTSSHRSCMKGRNMMTRESDCALQYTKWYIALCNGASPPNWKIRVQKPKTSERRTSQLT